MRDGISPTRASRSLLRRLRGPEGRGTPAGDRVPPWNRGRASFFSIYLVIFVDTLGYAAVVPLIPFALGGRHAPLVAVGTVFAAYSLCQLITAPLLGKLSDNIGRRPVLALSLAGSVIGFALLALSSAFPMVLLSRVIDGGSAGNVAMCYAMVCDSGEENTRRQGIAALGAAMGGGLVAGLGCGAFLSGFGFRAVALAAMLFSLLSFALTLVIVPETYHAARFPLQVAAALRIRTVRSALVLVALCAALQAAFLLTLPVYFATALELRAQAATFLIMFLILIAAAFQLAALPRLLGRLGSPRTAGVLLAVALCSTAALGSSISGTLGALLSSTVLTVAIAALSPISTLLLAESHPAVPIGLSMGLNTSSATVGQIIGPMIGYTAFALGGSLFLGVSCAALALCIAGVLGVGVRLQGSTSAREPATASQRERQERDPCPALWVVVPFRNEAVGIRPTLGALAAQRDRNFTLLLVDNGSTDGSDEVVRKALSTDSMLRWSLTNEPQKGTGAAADTGFRVAIAAGATHIARTDADCLPDPNWITAIRAGFASGAEMLAGKIGPRTDEEPLHVGESTFLRLVVVVAAWFGHMRPANHDRRYLTGYIMAPGNNLAITADLYLSCGGFPRTSIEQTHEDRALVNAVRLLTPHIAYRNDMIVLNSLRRLRRWGLWRTLLWYWDHRWLPTEVDIR